MNRPPLNTPPLPSLGTNALTFSVRGSSGGPHCPCSARVRTEEGGAGEGTGRGDSQGGREERGGRTDTSFLQEGRREDEVRRREVAQGAGAGGDGARTERDKGAQRRECEFGEQRCFQNFPSSILSPTREGEGKPKEHRGFCR